MEQRMTYCEKLAQADREAKAAVVGLVLTIIVWLACGIGLSGLDVKVFGTPLWIIGGTLGTWAFSIVVAVVLGRRVFVDFDLDDDASSNARSCQAASAAPHVAGTAHHAAGILHQAADAQASATHQAAGARASATHQAAGARTSATHQAAGSQPSATPAGKDGDLRG